MGWNPSWETETRVLVGKVWWGNVPEASLSGSREVALSPHLMRAISIQFSDPLYHINIICRFGLLLEG
jgi:hypothetical protein